MTVKNNSKGPRIVHAKGGRGFVPVSLEPGQSIDDIDLHDAANPVYKAWQDAGEVDFGGRLKEPSPERKKADGLMVINGKSEVPDPMGNRSTNRPTEDFKKS